MSVLTSIIGDERRNLRAIAQVALPPGTVLPGGCDKTVEQALQSLEAWPKAARQSYRALVSTANLRCLARTGRPLHKVSHQRLLELLETWRQGSYAERTALRLLLAPLKMSHFASPALYAHLGASHSFPVPTQDEKPRYVQERAHDLNKWDADEELECDVVVVGSGAGGAVVAHSLAAKGFAVVMVEEGDFFDRRDFTGRALTMQSKMYRDAGATVSLGNTMIPVPVGRTVGGTTTINSGTCYRVPERVLASWRKNLGLTDLTEENLAPHFEAVESVLQVETAKKEWVGGVGTVVARGCNALGYTRHGPLNRNAPECDGKGVCCFGCPTDAKRSTNVSYVPMALKAGAEILYRARVHEILVSNGRARGVVAKASNGKTVLVRAQATVLSCGALMTPVLLLQNGLCNRNGQLGKHLSIHPAQGVYAEFDEKICSYNAIPQGYGVEEFHSEGLLFEGASTPVEFAMSAIPFVGKELVDLAENYDRWAFFGFLVEDESRGRVRNVSGRPLITYRLGRKERRRLQRGVDIASQIFFAAGARQVLPLVHGFDRLHSPSDLDTFRRARLGPRDFDLTAYHPLGTARMGANPSSSVVGPDHQTHEVPGLYVVDGSSVPSSTAVNPQITIMALARRGAEAIAKNLGRKHEP